MANLVLFQSAVGLLLVEVREFDIVEASLTEVQGQISNYALFSKMVTPHSTIFFEEAEVALNNALKISRGELSPELQQLLGELASYKGRVVLGVADPKLAGRISEQLKLKTVSNAVVNEILRGVRTHFAHLMKKEGLAADMLEKAQLGMGHSVSRSRIALDVNREDKPIIQGINLIELLDKDLNTLSMRIREWYGWHFPELSKIIPESYTYIKLVKAIGSRDRTQVSLEDLEAIVGNEEVISNLVEAMKVSMGQQISEHDIECLSDLCDRVLRLHEYRDDMQKYLAEKMMAVAPNLTQVVGENIGAKLIAHSGSLTSLAKYPASTIQILGAEKALFRALKTQGNTPKYGLLYHSSFIGRAQSKDKGKISRFLANKCAIASRLDQFLVMPTQKFGITLKDQIERRLHLLEEGGQVDDNQAIMEEVLDQLKQEKLYFTDEKKCRKHLKKMSLQAQEEIEQVIIEKPKKKKKTSI